MDDAKLKRLVGLADIYELLAALTRFPEEELVVALAAGAVRDDAEGCCEDIGGTSKENEESPAFLEELGNVKGEMPELSAALRRAWSLLYSHQGSGVRIFPYESAFIHVKLGMNDAPALFRSKLTLKVEQAMREAGGLPATYATEPCDSAWDELAFLSYLAGCAISAGLEENEAMVEMWLERLAIFLGEHAFSWLPDFFRATREQVIALGAEGKVDQRAVRYYVAVSDMGLFALSALEELE